MALIELKKVTKNKRREKKKIIIGKILTSVVVFPAG